LFLQPERKDAQPRWAITVGRPAGHGRLHPGQTTPLWKRSHLLSPVHLVKMFSMLNRGRSLFWFVAVACRRAPIRRRPRHLAVVAGNTLLNLWSCGVLALFT
jgi:hypothetical protein